jgi:predicted DNA-binding transcriptional regulator AlpA
VTRRDTINGSIPGAFPQTFTMSKGRTGWVIAEIGR